MAARIFKVLASTVREGNLVRTPFDRKWGTISKIEKSDEGDTLTFFSPDWATESSKRYGDGQGVCFMKTDEYVEVKL